MSTAAGDGRNVTTSSTSNTSSPPIDHKLRSRQECYLLLSSCHNSSICERPLRNASLRNASLSLDERIGWLIKNLSNNGKICLLGTKILSIRCEHHTDANSTKCQRVDAEAVTTASNDADFVVLCVDTGQPIESEVNDGIGATLTLGRPRHDASCRVQICVPLQASECRAAGSAQAGLGLTRRHRVRARRRGRCRRRRRRTTSAIGGGRRLEVNAGQRSW